ncbi:MAG: sugar phosphate isomerase/epimerase [Lentisphaeria bacterium]|nr:sugar phosphate isomerase/epimerase [Lentisphaeria bacterium]
MKQIPLSYIPCGKIIPEEWLGNIFREFADNGAEYIVINEVLSALFIENPRFYSNLERIARKSGVTMFEVHAPFGECWDLNCSVKARRSQMWEEHIRIMNYCAEAGCKTYVIHIGAWDCIFRPEISIDTMRELALETLEHLLPAAEKAGIIIAVENSFEMSNSPDEVLWLIKHFNSPFIGCCFDTGHANYMAPAKDGKPKIYSKSQVELAWRGNLIEEPAALDKLLPHIVTCHIHDNNGLGDDHNLPGRGTIDWADMMPKLLSAPRLVSCQSEVGLFRYDISVKELCSTMTGLVYGNK